MGSEENPVVTGSIKLLEVMGFEAWRNNAIPVRGRRFIGKKGRGDILGLSPKGRFVSVECKKPGGKASAEQIEFVDEVTKRGGYAVVIESVMELYDYLKARMAELGEGF